MSDVTVCVCGTRNRRGGAIRSRHWILKNAAEWEEGDEKVVHFVCCTVYSI